MRAISTKWRRELSSSFFPARQSTKGNSRHSDRNIMCVLFEDRLTFIQFVVMMLLLNEVMFDMLQEKSMMAQRWMSGH